MGVDPEGSPPGRRPSIAEGLDVTLGALAPLPRPKAPDGGTACAELEASLRQSLERMRREPRDPRWHVNVAHALLAMGDFARGWAEYEWRLVDARQATPEHLSQTAWTPAPMADVLLDAERGLGDTIQFVRYARRMKQHVAYGGAVLERPARVSLRCPKRLVALLSSAPGLDHVGETAPPHFEAEFPLLSLPFFFGTTVETIPAEVPYLSAAPERIDRWKGELEAAGAFKVGIGWQGNPNFSGDGQRSIPLEHFVALGGVPGTRFFSLQKGHGAEQLAPVAARFAVTDLGARLDAGGDAYVDTAAVMKNLDLVITSDTSLAHLAGALAVPVWVILSSNPDWRWLLDRHDSPWYPTMRLFRQARSGDWAEVMQRVAAALAERTRERSRPDMKPPTAPPMTVEIGAGELIDKITILELKSERMKDPAKVANVLRELGALTTVRRDRLSSSEELTRLTRELKEINASLWEVEDAIRACEQRRDFGPRFVELARSVYRDNDRRAALKRRIDELVGSRLVEEKSYAPPR